MKERPVLFTAACWMSFIGSGLGIVSFFSAAVFYDFFSEKIISVTNLLSMQGTSPYYFLLMGVLNVVSFAGVVKMWKAIKSGFFFYLIAQLGIMFAPILFIGTNAFSNTNAIFTLMFLGIYFYYFRKIKL